MSSDDEHLDAGRLERYRRRLGAPAELLAADAHIAACDRCYQQVRADADAIELSDSHLSYEELEAYVDGRAGVLDHELVAEHTAACDRCRIELADLTATRDSLNPRSPRALHQVRLPRPRT